MLCYGCLERDSLIVFGVFLLGVEICLLGYLIVKLRRLLVARKC